MYGELMLRKLARCMVPQAAILLYHRVADTARDPQLLCVSPENFAGHMDVLRSRYLPAPLSARESWQPGSVVVTFDDGYSDNLTNAVPLLRQYLVPATVFVATGFLGDAQRPYWDELADLLLWSAVLPKRLQLTLNGHTRAWEFGSHGPVDPSWNLLGGVSCGRQHAYQVLCDQLRLSTPVQRVETMAQLREWAGRCCADSGERRFLTEQELRRLAEEDVVEIGAHTQNHANLALLSGTEQRCEIAQGRQRLEDICGQPVRSFAYPYGTRQSYARQTQRILQDEGFDCACANFGGAVFPVVSRFQLPRLLVRNWSAEEFAVRLAEYLK
ncbi:polysaccharide deacetylase family protein [Geomonas azotofigens]|uniref:polysaccharide deacetylase family protein n=1 Tax=Geomonas azotofigens TaxID=2843196 RepID=UPI001C0F861E|nr:polysaccharide deacetylase family protein [Geomonas azotofigens]MBU5612549.1 polysaccharide deacetylase family protein [Geomonas azotofigens]